MAEKRQPKARELVLLVREVNGIEVFELGNYDFSPGYNQIALNQVRKLKDPILHTSGRNLPNMVETQVHPYYCSLSPGDSLYVGEQEIKERLKQQGDLWIEVYGPLCEQTQPSCTETP